jgi:hypothetical protein
VHTSAVAPPLQTLTKLCTVVCGRTAKAARSSMAVLRSLGGVFCSGQVPSNWCGGAVMVRSGCCRLTRSFLSRFRSKRSRLVPDVGTVRVDLDTAEAVRTPNTGPKDASAHACGRSHSHHDKLNSMRKVHLSNGEGHSTVSFYTRAHTGNPVLGFRRYNPGDRNDHNNTHRSNHSATPKSGNRPPRPHQSGNRPKTNSTETLHVFHTTTGRGEI